MSQIKKTFLMFSIVDWLPKYLVEPSANVLWTLLLLTRELAQWRPGGARTSRQPGQSARAEASAPARAEALQLGHLTWRATGLALARVQTHANLDIWPFHFNHGSSSGYRNPGTASWSGYPPKSNRLIVGPRPTPPKMSSKSVHNLLRYAAKCQFTPCPIC